MWFFRDKDRRTHNDKMSVVREKRAFSVELFVAGRHGDGVLEFEKSVENHVSDLVVVRRVLVVEELAVDPVEKVCRRGRALDQENRLINQSIGIQKEIELFSDWSKKL